MYYVVLSVGVVISLIFCFNRRNKYGYIDMNSLIFMNFSELIMQLIFSDMIWLSEADSIWLFSGYAKLADRRVRAPSDLK